MSTCRCRLRLQLLGGFSLAFLLMLSFGRFPAARAQGRLHTLTESDNNTTITVPVGDSIELKLPTDLTWDVSISNASVLKRPPVALATDVQGLWDANAAGESVITANGTPQCNTGEACPQFIVHFQTTVEVTGSAPPSGQGIDYPAGWNLVGGPDGATFPVTLYQWDVASGQYQTISAGTPVTGGQGYWAYFSAPTSVALNGAGAASVSIPAIPGQWLQIANPSGTAKATVSGADAVDTYDPSSGSYSQDTTLEPGQGAWAYAANPVTIQIATSSPSQPPSTGTQQCGSVNSLGGHVTSTGAQQAESCFAHAYQTCSPATLTASINAVDSGTTHTFTIQNSAGSCTVTDTAQTRVIPRPAGPATTYSCGGVSQMSSGLVVSGCGSEGDVTVPAPSGQ